MIIAYANKAPAFIAADKTEHHQRARCFPIAPRHA